MCVFVTLNLWMSDLRLVWTGLQDIWTNLYLPPPPPPVSTTTRDRTPSMCNVHTDTTSRYIYVHRDPHLRKKRGGGGRALSHVRHNVHPAKEKDTNAHPCPLVRPYVTLRKNPLSLARPPPPPPLCPPWTDITTTTTTPLQKKTLFTCVYTHIYIPDPMYTVPLHNLTLSPTLRYDYSDQRLQAYTTVFDNPPEWTMEWLSGGETCISTIGGCIPQSCWYAQPLTPAGECEEMAVSTCSLTQNPLLVNATWFLSVALSPLWKAPAGLR